MYTKTFGNQLSVSNTILRMIKRTIDTIRMHDAVAVKGHCKGILLGVQIIGLVPIEIPRYLFFAI